MSIQRGGTKEGSQEGQKKEYNNYKDTSFIGKSEQHNCEKHFS